MTTGGNATGADLVERVAEAIHAVEYGRFSPDAGTAHNRHTWPNTTEWARETYRLYAAAAVAAMEENPRG